MTRLPQVLVNVPDVDKARADEDFVLAAAVAEAEAELGDTGRVLLRPSGTEPLVRVMVEAATAEQAQEIADRLAGVVGRAARADLSTADRGCPRAGSLAGRRVAVVPRGEALAPALRGCR